MNSQRHEGREAGEELVPDFIADGIVTDMEERARRTVPELPVPAAELPVQARPTRVPYAEIFSNRLYLQRTVLLVVVWFLGYVTIYAIAQGLTTLLAGILPPPDRGSRHRAIWPSNAAEAIR